MCFIRETIFYFISSCILGFVSSAGVFLSRYTIEEGLVPVALTYGLMQGFGIALAYATPLSCAMQVTKHCLMSNSIEFNIALNYCLVN